MPEVSEICDLRAWLAAEIAREEDGIHRNLGAGLMHMNDQAYMIGLVRNSVRREILARVDEQATEHDTERLNWLEENPEAGEPFIVYHPPDGVITWKINRHFQEYDTLRAAIDAARAGEKV